MKTKHFITIALLMCSLVFYSQESKKEKMKSLKIAYITNDLSLSSTESEKFWPIYNAFEEKQYELRMVKMSKIKQDLKNKPLDNFSEAEANALLNQMNDLEEELYLNKKKLANDLRKVISPIKILKLKQAEDNFNKSLLKQYRKRN